ncbi:hypothetical protein LZ30DRAFT_699901 [Colletotrichum cereale]|nr:hypothetical protein LZ30DRAFT_699901 [Colletotrichum cereale]
MESFGSSPGLQRVTQQKHDHSGFSRKSHQDPWDGRTDTSATPNKTSSSLTPLQNSALDRNTASTVRSSQQRQNNKTGQNFW